jgi:hypothetical protein
MTARHPEIGERVAQRGDAKNRSNQWVVYGRTEDLTNGADPRPMLTLERVGHPGWFWTVDRTAEGFWEEFVRIP